MLFFNNKIIFCSLFLFSWIGCKNTIMQEKDVSSSLSTSSSNKEKATINGIRKTYYDSGQLKTKGEYFLGLKKGLHKEWDEQGRLILEGFYSEGKANGLMKWYHEAGHIAGAGNMVNDIREGKWKICDREKDGFCINAFFVHGKREGVWTSYDTKNDKRIRMEEVYKNDKRISQKCWNSKEKEIACTK